MSRRSDTDVIDGTLRREMVVLAARAIIDSADDVVLWKMVNVSGGFERFRTVARQELQRHRSVRFTDQEIAWMYWFIEQHVATKATAAGLPADAPPPLPTTPRDPADGPVTIETDTRPDTVH